MNSFFRICIVMCIGFILFNVLLAYFASAGNYGFQEDIGISVTDESDALTTFTGLKNSNMRSLFLGVTTIAFLGAVTLSVFTRTVTPIGLYLFGLVFWTSWIKTKSILGEGGYIPDNFLIVFIVGALFIFIAAIIGILTRS